jgi:flagellar motor component MotA
MTEKETGTRLVAGILFFAMVLAAIMMGSPIEAFINAPSILITVGGGALLTVFAHGFGGIAAMRKISKEGGSRAQFEFAQTVAQGAAKQFERVGWLGTGIGVVQMLQQMDDPRSVGPAVAVALLCPFYAHLISASIFHPMAQRFDTRAKLA